jgi:zeaxanthin glucosyltransferase
MPQPDPGRPFVFASLGTLQGQRFGLFRRIAKACRRLDAQLLVAHCGGLDAARRTP